MASSSSKNSVSSGSGGFSTEKPVAEGANIQSFGFYSDIKRAVVPFSAFIERPKQEPLTPLRKKILVTVLKHELL